eukprot:CAMPEP_0113958488 /NCGR_PEP_ID=MMETSP0011_2-20120614/3461_1 /TAXON_ID=101924 /ORGANISM="Rhodosorus marinus" /LENGTH=31 /DNA_ID=CAMNT_0000969383 /DNA_START=85 /DNA_END=180 /DNA_ORIENTATION=+ /assembly_acc=CAM_ASM_000156
MTLLREFAEADAATSRLPKLPLIRLLMMPSL